jgi:hypothetical protein
MNNKKKAFVSLLFLAILGSGGAIFVAARGGPEGLHHQGHRPTISASNDIVSRLTTRLGLTSAQQEAARQVSDAMQKKAVAIRADTKLTREQKREKGRELMEEARDGIRKSLTPDQAKRMDAILAEMHGAAEGQGGH